MPVPELVHRYPDRVLLMVNNQCPIICRFCTRKRKIGFPGIVSRETLRQGIEYIRSHSEIRDVILSGGDPLLVPDKELNRILSELRSIDHLEIIRIGTRVPGALPHRVTPELCGILKKYHPLYFNIHFNHSDEITPEVEKACHMLADAGIPLGSQTVLLKGVNDNSKVMKELMQKLLKIRVKPYYIYQADMALGTGHFRTNVQGPTATKREKWREHRLCQRLKCAQVAQSLSKLARLSKRHFISTPNVWPPITAPLFRGTVGHSPSSFKSSTAHDTSEPSSPANFWQPQARTYVSIRPLFTKSFHS